MSGIKGAVADSAGCAIDGNRAPTKEQYRRAAMISDIAGAMSNGFKAEPDLSPCHLPLLSTEALERVHAESEKWRKSSRERELEQQLQNMINAEHEMSDYYLAIRGIIHALDMPAHFRSIDGSPAHIAWTEQTARELVKKAGEVDKLHDRNTALEFIIQRARDAFICRNITAHEMYQMLGAAKDIDAGGEWFEWDTDTMPLGLSDDTMVEVVTCSGTKISAQASAVNWSVVHEFRRVK